MELAQNCINWRVMVLAGLKRRGLLSENWLYVPGWDITYLLTYLLTYSLVELSPSRGAANSAAFYGTRWFITVFTRVLH
jgi:hypothetical protein